ncbi:MAG: hypothetical protein H0T45_11925 [Pyrinomonadaceae bacterium]|nr:hypothetical protein [Pyrinomonadaceae bacterium]
MPSESLTQPLRIVAPHQAQVTLNCGSAIGELRHILPDYLGRLRLTLC